MTLSLGEMTNLSDFPPRFIDQNNKRNVLFKVYNLSEFKKKNTQSTYL